MRIIMNIKTFMVAAVAALTLAACGEKAPETETVATPANEADAAASIELNDDGSVAAPEATATETPAAK
jgi:predicted small lipoprotein YifL